jgi:hypothetical protein
MRAKEALPPAVSPELEAARQDRVQAQEALEATRRQAAEEHISVIEPLRRTRREMLEYNHVTEDVMRHLRKRFQD